MKAVTPPKTSPMERLLTNAFTTDSYPLTLVLRKVRITTASNAPIGSISMPSHFNTVATFLKGFTIFSMGIITVGPDTVTSAPNSSDIFNPLGL